MRFAAALLIALALIASTVTYSEPWATSLDGWSYTFVSGTSPTCSLSTSTGNPSDSTLCALSGKNKTAVGYWTKALTWVQMGAATGSTVTQVDGQWDNLTSSSGAACTSSSTEGIQLFDSLNTTEVTATTVEPLINVSGDTTTWHNHNPTGAVNVNSSYQAAGTTITLRMNVNPATGNSLSAVCNLNTDNFSLLITYSTSSGPGPKHRVIHK